MAVSPSEVMRALEHSSALAKTLARAATAESPRASLATQPVNILLVDDDPRNLLALEAVLGTADHNLIKANSGDEALRWLLKEDFAVILLDVRMAGMDGLETATLIRQRPQARAIPIIFLTAANPSQTQVTRGYSLGAVDYILKPVDPEILRSKVAAFVELFKKTAEVQEQAEQLAEVTEFLETVLEGSTEYAIVAQNTERVVLAWNEGARRTYGYTANEIVGRNADMLQAPDDIVSGRMRAFFDTALQEGKAEGDFECVHQDGHTFVASVTASQRRNARGDAAGHVVISRDITEQRLQEEQAQLLVRAQAAREQAEAGRQRFAFLADVGQELASGLDYELHLQHVAAAVSRMLGDICTIDVMVNSASLRHVALAHADVGESAIIKWLQLRPTQAGPSPAVNDVLQSRQPCVFKDFRRGFIPCGEIVGDTRHLMGGSGLAVPIVAHDRVLGALTTLWIDKSRQFSEDDISLAEAVAHRIALAIENARLYGEAQDAVRIREDFLSSASHDLKTPLTIMKGQAQLLARKMTRGHVDPEHIKDGLAAIDATTVKMAALLDDMLDLATLQSGHQLGLRIDSIDLVKLVQHILERAPRPERNAPRIEFTSSEPELVGRWDPARLERVVENLIGNAIKYSPDGGAIEVAVRRQGAAESGEAVLTIRDHGIGIPGEDLPHVFERFYRASNVEGRAGTGIGLAGSQQIVRQHGGEIALQSREREGTTVTTTLPITGAEPE